MRLSVKHLISGLALVGLCWPHLPARSHQTMVSGQVGGTLHIEPNDTPRQGQPALTWFALTRRNGQVITLADCDCTLAIYRQRSRSPLGLLPLSPLSTGGYNQIPAATIVFPQIGQYNLVLQGRPQTAGTFTPFVLTFPVTVAQ